MKKAIKETDLYLPLKNYFEALGYQVFSEVKSCDMTAHKDEELIVVEIKTGFHTKLLFQALDRQKFADTVYMAIPKPKRANKDLGKIKYIAQKLNIGLIIISLNSRIKYIDILYQPASKDKKRDNSRKRGIIKEASGRTVDLNKAGSSQQKLATAYREKCVEIACILKQEGEITPKLLRDKYQMGTEAGRILLDNYYGWFDRICRGVYALSEVGLMEMDKGRFADLFKLYLGKPLAFENKLKPELPNQTPDT